jgi:GR25 family glycosyltransferase involved in LPS biosynthesis/Tfp pilus assembly protein PilF
MAPFPERPSPVDAATLAEANQLFAQALERHCEGELEQAMRLYEQVLQLAPEHFETLHHVGIASFQMGDPGLAEHFFRLSVGLRPDAALTHSALAGALHEQRKFEEALESYATAASLSPDNAEAYYGQAVTLQALQRLDDALASCDRALALDSNHDRARSQRAALHEEIQQRDAALARMLALVQGAGGQGQAGPGAAQQGGQPGRHPVKVISLARSTERRSTFSALNGHVDFEFFDAIVGASVAAEAARMPALFQPGLPYTAGAIGCAMSHLFLWQEAAATNMPITVLEDDAILRHDFQEQSARLLEQLPEEWDIMLLGYNFDAPLALQVMPGVSPAVVHFDQEQLRRGSHAFQALRETPSLMKLDEAFGICGYMISPQGARKLIAECFPLKTRSFYIRSLKRDVLNYGVDIPMCHAYSRLNSYCAFPPIVVSKNERATSTVQTGKS